MLPASMINFVTVRFSLNGEHSVGLSSFIVICYKVNEESCGTNAKSGRRDTGNNWLTVGRLRRGWILHIGARRGVRRLKKEKKAIAEEMRPVSQLLYLGRYYAKVGKNWSVKFCFPLLSHQCEIKRTVRISS